MPSTYRRSLSDFSEFQLIHALTGKNSYLQDPSLLKGIGDDTAIVQPTPDQDWLVSTDLLVEGIHFDRTMTSFQSIGHRAVIANLSDIAAMGGLPRYLLTAIAIPPSQAFSELRAVYRGILAACKRYQVQLIGGDTSASKTGLFLGMTILGTVARSKALLRGGAKIGDGVYTTGTLGDSLVGLKLLRCNKKKSRLTINAKISRYLIDRHIRPTPRIEIGQWLSSKGLATAAIDLSDGLSGDLTHLCRESGVGVMIDATKIPLSPQCQSFARLMNLDPLSLALEGGEDYELLFTAPKESHGGLQQIKKRFDVPVTLIGNIAPKKSGMRLKHPNGKTQRLVTTSYNHFQQKKP